MTLKSNKVKVKVIFDYQALEMVCWASLVVEWNYAAMYYQRSFSRRSHIPRYACCVYNHSWYHKQITISQSCTYVLYNAQLYQLCNFTVILGIAIYTTC